MEKRLMKQKESSDGQSSSLDDQIRGLVEVRNLWKDRKDRARLMIAGYMAEMKVSVRFESSCSQDSLSLHSRRFPSPLSFLSSLETGLSILRLDPRTPLQIIRSSTSISNL